MLSYILFIVQKLKFFKLIEIAGLILNLFWLFIQYLV